MSILASLLSRPLLRAFLAVNSLLHYNHFWRSETASPLPRTSWDVEFNNMRRLYMYAKGAGEITRGLCAALPFANLTERQVSVAPGLRAGGAIVRYAGQKRYIVALQSSGVAFNPYR